MTGCKYELYEDKLFFCRGKDRRERERKSKDENGTVRKIIRGENVRTRLAVSEGSVLFRGLSPLEPLFPQQQQQSLPWKP